MRKIFRSVLCVCVSIVVFFTCSVSTEAIVPGADQYVDYDVESFLVVSKDTIIGGTSAKWHNTELTTNALRNGVTTMSTPAYSGTMGVQGNNNQTISPNSVIGGDNRVQVADTTQWPYRAICSIKVYWDTNNDGSVDKTTKATGFLEGPSAVVTAGHVIYDPNKGGWCEYAEASFAQYYGTRPYGTIRSTTIHTSAAWINNCNTDQDWAIVEIESPIGNTVGWFGKLWTSGSLNGTTVTVTGYPGDKPSTTMWTGSGVIKDSLSARLLHDCDTGQGQSGAAILNSGNQAVAIHTNGDSGDGCNEGTRITEWLYNLLEQYR